MLTKTDFCYFIFHVTQAKINQICSHSYQAHYTYLENKIAFWLYEANGGSQVPAPPRHGENQARNVITL